MVPTGRWLVARVLDGGQGYAPGEVPKVDVSVPGAAGGRRASVKAIMFDGSVSGLQLLDRGDGYFGNVSIRIDPPRAMNDLLPKAVGMLASP